MGDYKYYNVGTGKNRNIYWACNKKNCKGRVKNEGNIYILTQEHQEERHIEGEGKYYYRKFIKLYRNLFKSHCQVLVLILD